MLQASMRTMTLPGPAWGVGMVLTSGGEEVEVRTRARCVLGRSCAVVILTESARSRFKSEEWEELEECGRVRVRAKKRACDASVMRDEKHGCYIDRIETEFALSPSSSVYFHRRHEGQSWNIGEIHVADARRPYKHAMQPRLLDLPDYHTSATPHQDNSDKAHRIISKVHFELAKEINLRFDE
jgi:hypothetical protein